MTRPDSQPAKKAARRRISTSSEGSGIKRRDSSCREGSWPSKIKSLYFSALEMLQSCNVTSQYA